MEHCVESLGARLGATVIDKNNIGLEWGPMVANINGKIDKLPNGDEKAELAAVASLLHYVRIAWRNPTMHPKSSYTDEEALDVFLSTKAFVGKLSDLI